MQQDTIIARDTARIASVKDTVRADSALSVSHQKQTFEWLLNDTTAADSTNMVSDSLRSMLPVPVDTLPDMSQPLYMKTGFLANDSLLSTARGHDKEGVAGDPVPYTLQRDDFFTALLLFCFVLFVVFLSSTRQFVRKQLKSIFYPTYNSSDITETAGEVRFQLFLVLLASLLLAITAYMLARDYVADVYILDDYALVGLLLGCFIAYFALKALLYQMVNSVFFPQAQQYEWWRTILFITAMEGALLFPVVLVQIYFDLAFEKAVYFYSFVFFLVKTLSFYKCWNIFFGQTGLILQFFLYFCTLEIVPPLVWAEGIAILVDSLKITI